MGVRRRDIVAGEWKDIFVNNRIKYPVLYNSLHVSLSVVNLSLLFLVRKYLN